MSAYIKIEEEDGGMIQITGTVKGLPVNENITKFGFHIHEKAFENQDCTTAGSHFNPLDSSHGEQKGAHGTNEIKIYISSMQIISFYQCDSYLIIKFR